MSTQRKAGERYEKGQRKKKSGDDQNQYTKGVYVWEIKSDRSGWTEGRGRIRKKESKQKTEKGQRQKKVGGKTKYDFKSQTKSKRETNSKKSRKLRNKKWYGLKKEKKWCDQKKDKKRKALNH